MHRRWLALLTLIAVLGLVVPSVLAEHGQGKGKGKGKGNPHAGARHDRNDEGWERHDQYETRIYRLRDGVPPGWSKGKKTGWANCGLPPGQAKKYGYCHTYVHRNRRYYYYRDDIGRIIVHRPRIEIHAVIP